MSLPFSCMNGNIHSQTTKNRKENKMRKPRCYYESKFYHVMIQGDEKKYIFQNDESM